MSHAAITLGERLGLTRHESPLRHRVRRLMRAGADRDMTEEDWLAGVAYHRGLRVVFPPDEILRVVRDPGADLFPDEELVTAICLLPSRDQPQILRLAAQRISRGGLDLERLARLTRMERTEPVLRELCAQALKVEPNHPEWRALHALLPETPPLREPLVHWTRLAEPIMNYPRLKVSGWRLNQ